jgi:hypothetical protein
MILVNFTGRWLRRQQEESQAIAHHDGHRVAVELDLSLQTHHFTAHLTTRDYGFNAVVDLIFNTYRDGNRGRPPQASVCPAIFPGPEEFPTTCCASTWMSPAGSAR